LDDGKLIGYYWAMAKIRERGYMAGQGQAADELNSVTITTIYRCDKCINFYIVYILSDLF
jgi:hypothetical protein